MAPDLLRESGPRGLPDRAGWNPDRARARRNVVEDDCSGADLRTITDHDRTQDLRAGPDQYVVADPRPADIEGRANQTDGDEGADAGALAERGGAFDDGMAVCLSLIHI